MELKDLKIRTENEEARLRAYFERVEGYKNFNKDMLLMVFYKDNYFVGFEDVTEFYHYSDFTNSISTIRSADTLPKLVSYEYLKAWVLHYNEDTTDIESDEVPF